MTEQEWLTCPYARDLLILVQGRLSSRKLRLFALACCRLLLPWLADRRSRRAIEVAERFADGQATEDELDMAYEEAWQVVVTLLEQERSHTWLYHAARMVEIASCPPSPDEEAPTQQLAMAAANQIPKALSLYGLMESSMDARIELGKYAALVREICPNPFRPPPLLDTAWLAWNDATIKRLAEAIYEQEKFEDMPILADALEDGGCGDAGLLGHLRGSGPHVRGCWALDLLLGKE